MSTQAEIVERHANLKARAEAEGLTLESTLEDFRFVNMPGSNGIIAFKTLDELELFLRGYELGKHSLR